MDGKIIFAFGYMKFFLFSITAILFLVPSGICHSSETIVPKNEQISDFETEFALAKILSHHKETQEAALTLYDKLLQENPDNIELAIDIGRLYITLKHFQEGLEIFYSALKRHPCNLKLLIATAQGEVVSGHPIKAKALFLKALDYSEDQEAILIDYADGMMSWGDYYKAEQIYRDALNKNPATLDLYFKLIWSLESPQRYEEAEGILSELLSEDPKNPKILESLANLKILEKDFDKAQETVEILLQLEPAAPKYLLLKGEILFKKRLYCDAIAVYNEFKNDRKYGVQAYIGMGRSYGKMGRDDEAQAAFQQAYSIDPEDIEAQYYAAGATVEEEAFIEEVICASSMPKELLEWANVYIQNGMPDIALSFYNAILELDPDYFPAQIGRAETLSTLFFHTCAIEIYQELLQEFPENAKLMLALARAFAWNKQFDTAITIYDSIIDLNPQDPVPYREKARTALWNKQFDLAMETYDALLEPEGEDLDEYLIQTSIALEKRAKWLNWNKRYISSLPAYRDLLAFNPGNEEAMFDYAQVYCNLGLCDYSRCIYEDILNLDPNHSLVKIALERIEERNHWGFQANLLYWREIGSGSFSASQIARYRLDEVFEIPLTCRMHLRFIQQEYVENPFLNFKFYPAEGQTIEGDYIYNENIAGFVSATYKNYFHKFRSTVTSHNRLLFTVNDYLKILLSCNKEDEIYNFFSLKQAIQSTVSLITLSSTLTRYWIASGTYQYYSYNDDNSQFHFNLLTEYQFSEDPDVFKVILQGDYRNAAHQSISIFVGTQLVDMIHPYWTPNKYLAGALTLEYRHDFREFVFCGAPERYIDIKITGGTDNTKNPSIEAIVEWKHELLHHWGFEVKALIHRSPLWNAEGAWGTVYYRF